MSIRGFVNRTKLIFRTYCFWIPKLYKDKDWDEHYLFQIIKWKIEKMLDYSENHSPIQYEGQESDQKKMREAIEIIDRIMADDYLFDENGEVVKGWKEADDDLNEDIRSLFDLLNENIRKWWI